MSEIKPCPKITQAEIDAGVAVMWRYAIDDIVRVQTPDHVLARLHTEYCDVFRSAYTAAMAVRAFRDRASDACASVQKERDDLREELTTALRLMHTARHIAIIAHGHWDGDEDSKVGKLLLALSGLVPKYRADIDEIHAFLSRYEGEVK